ncbi:uncharacterized protein LOC121859138 [Homarus americanus]|uniref:uncharacterized protein LOC121859138 n=1 Tax=Homarus americanus TaxID=6706 RepID=UPI001C4436D9|nr:uncharacterized protein LOC121859138 [Homarus americanus]
MAGNNSVPEDSAAPTLTKLRLLCNRLVQEAKDMEISVDDLMELYLTNKYCEFELISRDKSRKIAACANSPSAKPCHWWRWWAAGAILVLVFSVLLNSYVNIFTRIRNEFITSKCIVRNNYFMMEATRPRTKCGRVCGGVGGPVELNINITRAEFERWAYLSRPLVVRGGAAQWPALETFSVAFFRSIYDSVEGSYDAVTDDCQFLPFRTEFVDLGAALAMHPARAARLPGTPPWYFGW